jgi:hypothetical protein
MKSALTSECGVGAAETEESVTPGRIRKRKRSDSQRSFIPDKITLGAMSTGVKQYNLGMNSSMILTIVVALLFQGKSMRDPDSMGFLHYMMAFH